MTLFPKKKKKRKHGKNQEGSFVVKESHCLRDRLRRCAGKARRGKKSLALGEKKKGRLPLPKEKSMGKGLPHRGKKA